MSFTVVFEDNLRAKSANPLTTETPFGVAYAVGIGDQFAVADIYREALEKIADGNTDGSDFDVAQAALDAADALILAETKAGRK